MTFSHMTFSWWAFSCQSEQRWRAFPRRSVLRSLVLFFLLSSFLFLDAAPARPAARDESSEQAQAADDDSASTEAPGAAAAPLLDSTGQKTTFGALFGDQYKVVLFTKPWSDTNAQLIGELSHFRLRLNRGGLRSGVIFLRSDLAEAARTMKDHRGRVKYAIDPDGRLASLLGVKTMPALILVDPEDRVKYSTPLLAQDLVRQVAAHYHQPEKLFPSPRASGAPRRPGVPPAKGNTGHYSIR